MPRRSRSDRSTASPRSAAASPCSTAWPTRASTSSSATAPAAAEATPPVTRMLEKGVQGLGRHRRDARRLLQPVGLAVLAGHRQDGRRPAASRRSATASTARRRCGCGPRRSTWFSNEEGKKGRSRRASSPTWSCRTATSSPAPNREIADTTALLTMVGGKVVYAAGDFQPHSTRARRRRRCPTGRRCAASAATAPGARTKARRCRRRCASAAAACGCASACGVHGHSHASAWASKLPVSDLKSFWGALGCACWAV